MTDAPQAPPISAESQKHIQKLQVRISDMMDELNEVIRSLVAECEAKDKEIQKYKGQAVQAANSDVKVPPT